MLDALARHTRVQLADLETQWSPSVDKIPGDVLQRAAKLTLLVRALNSAQSTFDGKGLAHNRTYDLVFVAADHGDPEAKILIGADQITDGK